MTENYVTLEEAEALLRAFPSPPTNEPQCPDCKAWYVPQTSNIDHQPGCSELKRREQHEAAALAMGFTAYRMTQTVVALHAEIRELQTALRSAMSNRYSSSDPLWLGGWANRLT